MAPGSSTKSRGESSATPLALASAKGQARVPVCHFRDARDGAGFGHDGRGRVVVRLLRLSRCGIAAGVQRNDDAVLLHGAARLVPGLVHVTKHGDATRRHRQLHLAHLEHNQGC